MEILSNIFNKLKPKVIFDAGYLQVIDINGYNAIQEKDMVVCIPYFVESGSILLRYENVPAFEMVRPEIDRYVNVMSRVVDKDVEQSLRDGLKDEFGIVLAEEKRPEILSPIFINKGNTARYHVCILPLMSYDYDEVRNEDVARSSNIKVQISDLDNLIIYDMITRHCLDIFKKDYSLF